MIGTPMQAIRFALLLGQEKAFWFLNQWHANSVIDDEQFVLLDGVTFETFCKEDLDLMFVDPVGGKH